MAFNNSNSLTSHLEDLRSRNLQSTAAENSNGYTNPSRYSGSFMTTHSQSSNEVRASLQRRFTTDLGKMSTLTPIGQPPASKAEPVDISGTVATNFHLHQSKLVEKKRRELEYLREQSHQVKQMFEEHKHELDQMTQDLNRVNLFAGHQSEPTTPPEYRDNVFPSTSVFSRTNRYSVSSLASPPGLNNRSSRSGSQLTSPPTELAQTLHNHISSDTLPSKSVPGSRRGSNDRVSVYIPEINGTGQRVSAPTNRYSMPVTSSTKRYSEINSDFSSVMGVGQIGFLFGDEDEKSTHQDSTSSPHIDNYLKMNATTDKFPILVTRKDNPGRLSASSTALDLALSQPPGTESQSHGWTPFARHRSSQNSISQNILNAQDNDPINFSTPTSVSQQSPEAIGNSRQLHRLSMEASVAAYTQASLASQTISNDTGRPSISSIQSSYSTNDIPTVKSTNGLGAIVPPIKTQAEQQFHNHNASLGRIPVHRANNRHSRDLSGSEARREDSIHGYQYLSSALHGTAANFGSSSTATSPIDSLASGFVQMNVGPQYATPAIYGGYGGYGLQLTNMGMAPIPMANALAFNSQMQQYQPQNAFTAYQAFVQPPRFGDSQARVIQQRRLQNGEDNSRFTNVKLEQVQGDIYSLCKDQHGCRFLQKKLEERNPEYVHIIFLETNQHVVELMTDPFGNYLCQKLLEFSNEDQRTILINNAAPQMVKIALNQHGTRALQKMIEFITSREQIETIIRALKDRVVELIQDLNGNHVIQKCLNRLTPEDAQFIFDGVGNNCIVVGTHRHGCCVLQRCIDHASGHQKAHLIRQITANAFSLIQDPFGNYVVQYIVDLSEPAFTDPLCYSFQGNIPQLSKQKFSSNVIEKCLRGAQSSVTRMMIEEMLNKNELEKMLSDSYANYVVQTAIDYADPDTKSRLVDAIRPILPSIRQTPYGRRIQSKIVGSEVQGRGRLSSGPATPHDGSSPGQIPLAKSMHSIPSASLYGSSVVNSYQGINNSFITTGPATYQTNANMNHMGPFPHTTSTSSTVHAPAFGNASNFSKFSSDENINSVQQPTTSYPRTSQVSGFNYF